MRTVLSYLFALIALMPTVAFAGGLSVSPVRVELSSRAPSALLRIYNNGERPLRLQAKLFAWSQSRTDDLALSPTKDIAHFPQLLEIPPHTMRNIRVSAMVPVSPIEKSYRILIEELPDSQGAAAPDNEIRLRTRLSIPIFWAPAHVRTQLAVRLARTTDQLIVFSVENRGSTSTRLTEISFTGYSTETGRSVLTGHQKAWYLLAGAKREYAFRIPTNVCGAGRLHVTISAERGPVLADFPWAVNCRRMEVRL